MYVIETLHKKCFFNSHYDDLDNEVIIEGFRWGSVTVSEEQMDNLIEIYGDLLKITEDDEITIEDYEEFECSDGCYSEVSEAYEDTEEDELWDIVSRTDIVLCGPLTVSKCEI